MVKYIFQKRKMVWTWSWCVAPQCAGDKQTCDIVPQYNGLQPLVSLLKKANNKQLLVSATGIIWRCSAELSNVAKYASDL